MSRVHRISRSLGVASIGLILVSGASFAHDASTESLSSTTTWESTQGGQAPDLDVVDRQRDVLDEVEQEDQVIGGTPDDLDGPAEAETGDSDKADESAHEAAKPAAAPKVHKASKTHKASTAKSSDDENENDDNDNEADDNDQGGDHQDGDHQGGDHEGGDHGDGGHDDSGSGGDD